jgi:TonB family protein
VVTDVPSVKGEHVPVRELDFGQHFEAASPHRRRAMFGACAAALALHVIAVLGLIRIQESDPVRAGTETPSQEGISAFVFPAARPTGTTGMSKPVARTVQRARTAAPDTTQSRPASVSRPGSGEATDALEPQGDTPVRLGAGQKLGLLKKVDPVYPPTMQAAGVEGFVVLDAVIHRDGTIGDITVLKSSNPAFEQAAIDAVKQWRYTPLPYEGIVTVTLRFTAPR